MVVMETSLALSRCAGALKRSVMRDLLAQVARPGILNFAGGLPADENLPRAQLQTCFDAVLTRDGARALQYGAPYAPLREWIAAHMRTRGVTCQAQDIFITNGNQQGLELVARLLLDEGDAVAVEEFTFTGILQAAQGRGAALEPVPVDRCSGIEVDALEEILFDVPNVRLIAVIPDFHNPLGVSARASKRIALAQLAARFGVPIVEDAPYSPLRFHGEPIAAVKTYDETDSVFYLGSFSKMISPALRLGWMVAPRPLLSRLTVLREALDLESSQLIQRVVAEFFARGYLEPHLEQLNRAHRARCGRMLGALERHFDGIGHWTIPDGGLFIWLTLPAVMDTQDLLRDALERGLAFVPGSAFAAQSECDRSQRGGNSMRLNFSNAPSDQIEHGIEQLAALVRERLHIAAVGVRT